MKASELIRRLVAAMGLYGDIRVFYEEPEDSTLSTIAPSIRLVQSSEEIHGLDRDEAKVGDRVFVV